MVAGSPTEGATAQEVLARLIQATDGKSASALARLLGVSSQAIYNAKRKSKIPLHWVHAVSDIAGVRPEWLLTGNGEERYSADAVRSFSEEELAVIEEYKSKKMDRFICIPMVEPLTESFSDALSPLFDKEQYAFNKDFLWRKGDPSRMVLMRVSGDSMEPIILDNDVTLIDMCQTTPLAGKLFAVAVGSLVYVKMIDAVPGGMILKSQNKAYPPLEIRADTGQSREMRILGRVVWIGRELT
ncbi:Phage repressor protein C, contains Cro/C1-type HTH and peptisase s24 domains [Humidesulfovibrio mexicanus]|uniref:Phage repressor protein C, contains Cro/C1-type HTH and peptisase s24 domains n=1 Tax=Humidesulfovibrio mexicanus TaxID=147047 RepID=A0A238XK09_9BACT|nr:Phage repressor protein C, contains Cro/C1-type HTH and peptisase s24 domains [Humidesulfovibrio mexicanus]